MSLSKNRLTIELSGQACLYQRHCLFMKTRSLLAEALNTALRLRRKSNDKS